MTAADRPAVPELLAPAGSEEALRAAIGAGADAVYLGGTRYGARQYAQNFDEKALPRAIDFAHARDVRVYVTVNTLIAERELPAALDYLVRLYQWGADAVLLQDPGLAALAREVVPGLPRHASTQMTVHSSEGVAWAADQGFSRVVLARELSLVEVEAIARATAGTGIGLEVFAHGALCYAYSGQCLLSSVIGGRSGNRGRCAQPCRKPYRVVKGPVDAYDRIHAVEALPECHPLSPRDLCTYDALDRVVRAPLAALKIEGRMKSPGYGAVVVGAYRRALDAHARGENPAPEDRTSLALAFNRGFTRGHLLGAPRGRVLGGDPPNHHGLFVGTVLHHDPRSGRTDLALASDVVPSRGDGLHILSPGGGEAGLVVKRTEQRGTTFTFWTDQPVREGDRVFITSRLSLEKEARRIVRDTRGRPLPLEVSVEWVNGTPRIHGRLFRRHGSPLEISWASTEPWRPAEGRPLDEADICTALSRTGTTPFRITACRLRYPGGLYLPPGKLNQVRRDFLAAVERVLLEASRPSEEDVRNARARQAAIPVPSPELPPTSVLPRISLHTDTPEGVQAAIEGGADRVCLETISPDRAEEALRLCREKAVPFAWQWPRVTRDGELRSLAGSLDRLVEAGLGEVVVASAGAARAVRAIAPGIPIGGWLDLHVWNHRTVEVLSPLFSSLLLSPELSCAQIGDLAGALPVEHPMLGLLVQGNLEAMVSENCPAWTEECPVRPCPVRGPERWGLRDARDRIFPLETDERCRVHLFNAVETALLPYLADLRTRGVGLFSIDARYRGPQYAREMCALYKEAVSRILTESAPDLSDLNEQVRVRARGGLTQGLLLSGVRE